MSDYPVFEYEELVRDPISRRAFMARMSAAGLGAAATIMLASGCGTTDGSGTGNNFSDSRFPGIPGRSLDEVVLNYALTLEIIEAYLYRVALNKASGRPLATALDTSISAYTQAVGNGAAAGSANGPAFAYLRDFAYVEAAHRDFLKTYIQSIGGTPVVEDPKGYHFPTNGNDPGGDMGAILTNILPLEETGVRAYLGAAGFISDLSLTTVAVAIHSTEARHSAAVAYILGKNSGPTYLGGDKRVTDGAQAPNPAPYHENTFQYYLDPATVIAGVKQFMF